MSPILYFLNIILFLGISLQIVGIATDSWLLYSAPVTVENSNVTRMTTHLGLWRTCTDFYHADGNIGISGCGSVNLKAGELQQSMDATRSFAIIGASLATLGLVFNWVQMNFAITHKYLLWMFMCGLFSLVGFIVFAAKFKEVSGLTFDFGYSWILFMMGALLIVSGVGLSMLGEYHVNSRRHTQMENKGLMVQIQATLE